VTTRILRPVLDHESRSFASVNTDRRWRLMAQVLRGLCPEDLRASAPNELRASLRNDHEDFHQLVWLSQQGNCQFT
jgi:hypothetical protein